jgi:hypothetical protein
MTKSIRVIAVTLTLIVSVGAIAQTGGRELGVEDDRRALDLQSLEQRPLDRVIPGRNARSSVGEAGKRLATREAEGPIKTAARINNRVQNRVQSRLRNRIDRSYDPQVNATSPFAVAEDQTRKPARRR